jgi:hypothetical protein
MGEDEFADELRDLFERGSAWTDANLFNGEYYEQQVRSIAPDDIADGLGINLQEVKPEAPSIQIGDGCLVDQLVGQQFAHLVGLGYLLKPENVRNTAAGIRRYNRVSMAEHECLGRTFALNDEEGMVICSWPKQQDTNRMVHWFFTEFMTGFEYSAAILMLQEGLLKEGISAIADIRERYDGRRRNPWNEAECGSHYARAMAAWAAVPTLSGFHYSAITGRMEFVPRLDAEPFRCAWAAGGAWGSIEISRRSPSATLKVMHGELALHTLVLPPELAQSHQAALNDSTVATDICREDDRAIFHLEETARVHEGSLLQLQSR